MAYILANIMYFIGLALLMLAMISNFITPFISFGLFGYGLYSLFFTNTMFGLMLIGASVVGGAIIVFLTAALNASGAWCMSLIDRVIE